MVKQIGIYLQENLLRTFGFMEDQKITNSGGSNTVLKPGINLEVGFRSDTDGWSEDISKRKSEGWFYGMEKVDNSEFEGGGIRLRMDLK